VGLALHKGRFWQRLGAHDLNGRQRKVVNCLLDAGPEGFEGGLTNRKYRGMTSASAATALRDLQDLVQRGVLVRAEGGGRSARYDLPWREIAGESDDGSDAGTRPLST
jgi:Fic family protein